MCTSVSCTSILFMRVTYVSTGWACDAAACSLQVVRWDASTSSPVRTRMTSPLTADKEPLTSYQPTTGERCRTRGSAAITSEYVSRKMASNCPMNDGWPTAAYLAVRVTWASPGNFPRRVTIANRKEIHTTKAKTDFFLQIFWLTKTLFICFLIDIWYSW